MIVSSRYTSPGFITNGKRLFALSAMLAALPLSALAADAKDPATMLPGNAIAYIEWVKLSHGDSSPLTFAVAFLKSSFGKEMIGKEQPELLAAATLAEQVARYSGGVAMLPAKKGNGYAVLIEAGTDADALAKTLEKAILGAGSAKPQKAAIGGIDFSRAGSDESGPHWAVKDGRVLVAADASAAAALADAVSGKDKKPLALNAELKLCRSKVKSSSEWRLVLWADLAAAGKAIVADRPSGAPHVEDETPWKVAHLDAFRSAFIQLDETAAGSRMFAFAHVDDFKHGVPKLYQQSSVGDSDLVCIPKDASWACVCKLDLQAAYADLMADLKTVDSDAEESVAGGVAIATKVFGLTTDEFFGAFGDGWALYDSPSHAGVSLTGMTLVAEVKSPKAVHGILTRLAEAGGAAASTNGIKLKLEQMKDGEHTIHYAVLAGSISPVAPAWGFAGDRCVIALSPQTAAIALRQVDSKTRKESMLNNEDYKRMRPQLPKDLSSFWYSDIRSSYAGTYGTFALIRTAAASLTAGEPGAPDIGTLPTFVDSLAGVHNMVGGCTRDSDGISYISQGAWPGAALLSNNNLAPAALSLSILMPSLPRARELAKRDVSSANMRNIGLACHIYANDNGEKFPESLEELLKKEILTPKVLVSPRDDDGVEGKTVSYIYIAGQSSGGNPQNILAYEKMTGAEGTNVLFLDGHVEWMRPEAFGTALAETNKRLKKD